MRILNIRFKNLNSLTGEWEIDLTHPAYISDGIFAITGPTGSGKTTILDALCLALYGRTPRLDKVTKSANEIMSRQTGECFSEVTFETQAGRYRCHWSQHRARRKPDGELQNPKHEITDADTGEIYENKIIGVAVYIESVTGMDFDRFTRSMLLAQGSFAAFLQATPADRAPILEQITGTEIYSRLSIKVHERTRVEKERLVQLEAEIAGINCLTAEDEQEQQQELERKKKNETILIESIKEIETGIAWLTAITDLEKEITALEDEIATLNAEIENFTPDRERLDKAMKAATLDGKYAALTAIRTQQINDHTALNTEEANFPALHNANVTLRNEKEAAEQHSTQIRNEMKIAAPIWQQMRSLDQRLDDQKKTVAEQSRLCENEKLKVRQKESALSELKKEHVVEKEKFGQVESYLKEHEQDEWLLTGLTGVEEKLNALQEKRNSIIQKENDCNNALKTIEQAESALDNQKKRSHTLNQKLTEVLLQLQQGREDLNMLIGERSLREYRNEKEALLREQALLTRIMELEEHRVKLEDGKPCPLCGATEHPYAKGNVPVTDEGEAKIEALSMLITQAEQQEEAVNRLEKTKGELRQEVAEAEKLEFALVNNKSNAEKVLFEAKTTLTTLRTDYEQRRNAVAEILAPLGITDFPEDKVSVLCNHLKERLNSWQNKVKEKTEIEKQLSGIDSDMKSLIAVMENLKTALAENLESLTRAEEKLTNGYQERLSQFGERNPDEEERQMNDAIDNADAVKERVIESYNNSQHVLISAETRIKDLNKNIASRKAILDTNENEFSMSLERSGFLNEELFLEAILIPERRDELETVARTLENRETDIKARQQDRVSRLAAEKEKKITDAEVEELELRLREQQSVLGTLRDNIAEIRLILSQNENAKKQVEQKKSAFEAQKKDSQRWENLHTLIGSADGKKYRNFAQGLTFEIMIGHANRQLQKMTDRYLLVHASDPLELNVIDNYQAGETRSTKSLSGGESFIVSLSLALGLSHMTSENVRVDSLFLDEGFGTLDDEALDTALDTLAGLQHDGKVIGLISHVPALRERISAQISVTPLSGGRSSISGPGCRGIGAQKIDS